MTMDSDNAAVDDAIVEDTTHCHYCRAAYDVSEVCVYPGGLVLCDECQDTDAHELIAEILRLRAALEWYADPATYLARWPEPHDQATFEEAAIETDRGQRARDVLDPQPAENVPQNAPRMPASGPEGPGSADVPATPETGAS